MEEKSVKIFIDDRPLWIVFLTRSYRFILLGLIGFGFYFYTQQTPFEGLSQEAYLSIGAFLLCFALWVTHLVPMAVTGLLAICIIPLLGIMTSHESFSYFGNEAVFFILGSFILSAAMLKTGLSIRLAILLLKRAGQSPEKLTWRILLSCALLSCIMPEHAVAAFFFPLILEMAHVLKFQPYGGSYGRSLFVSMSWGCIIGGIVTFLGGGRAPLALGMMKELTGHEFGFFEWMLTTIPIAIPLLFIGHGIIKKFFASDVESVDQIYIALDERRKKIGLMKWSEKWVALVLSISILSWIFFGQQLGLANIAIAAIVLLFLFNVLEWKDVEARVNWGIVLMFGGAICLGRSLDSTGAIHWIADNLVVYPEKIVSFFSMMGLSLSPSFVLIVLLVFFSILLSEMVSNSAVVAILLPLAIGMAESQHIDPSIMAYVVAVPAGLVFLLPIATPAMALAYSSGYIQIRDMLLPGILMDILAWLVVVLVFKFWWPVIGVF